MNDEDGPPSSSRRCFDDVKSSSYSSHNAKVRFFSPSPTFLMWQRPVPSLINKHCVSLTKERVNWIVPLKWASYLVFVSLFVTPTLAFRFSNFKHVLGSVVSYDPTFSDSDSVFCWNFLKKGVLLMCCHIWIIPNCATLCAKLNKVWKPSPWYAHLIQWTLFGSLLFGFSWK